MNSNKWIGSRLYDSQRGITCHQCRYGPPTRECTFSSPLILGSFLLDKRQSMRRRLARMNSRYIHRHDIITVAVVCGTAMVKLSTKYAKILFGSVLAVVAFVTARSVGS